MDFFSGLYNNIKNFLVDTFSKKKGSAALQAYAPFGLNPTPNEQKTIQQIPQISNPPLGPGAGIEAIKIASPTSPATYQYIPPKTEVPMSGSSIMASPVTAPPTVPSAEAARINSQVVTAPLPTIPTNQFVTGEPTVNTPITPSTSGATTTSGISQPLAPSSPSSPSGGISAPSGGSSGYFSGFSPSTLFNFAKSMNIPMDRINAQTGEIINPTQDEINAFNKRYKTTPTPEPIISPITAPTIKTAAITSPNLPAPSAPAINENYINSLNADLATKKQALIDSYNKQLADTQTKIKESQQNITNLESSQKNNLNEAEKLTAPFRQQLEDANREKLYINKNFEENQKLTDELATLLTDGNAEITAIKSTPGVPSAIMNRKVAGKMSDITARAGVIQATLAARNNQISQAYTLIDRSINAINADRQDQLNYYKTINDFYQNQKDEEGKKLITLKTDEKTYINSQIGMLEDDMKQSVANAENLKKAMTDPDTALAYASAGVTLNDTPQQINEKLAKYAYAKEVSDTSNKMALQDYNYLAPGHSAPADSQVVTTTDSQGNKKYWYKPRPKSSTPTPFGAPDSAAKSVVFSWLGSHPNEATTIDQNKLETDPTYFWWVYNQTSQ